MGQLLRLLAAAAILAAAAPIGSAAAQAGAGQGLSSPTDERPAPAEAAPPPRTDGAAPGATGEPTYVQAPPGYGTGYGGSAYAVEAPPRRPRSTVDRTPKHVGNIMSIIGAAALANGYLTVALVGLYGSSDWLMVPVIGPFAAIAENSSFDNPLYWIDGVVQLVGAAALAVGLGLRFSFDDSPSSEGEARLAPWLGPGSGGLGLSGTF